MPIPPTDYESAIAKLTVMSGYRAAPNRKAAAVKCLESITALERLEQDSSYFKKDSIETLVGAFKPLTTEAEKTGAQELQAQLQYALRVNNVFVKMKQDITDPATPSIAL